MKPRPMADRLKDMTPRERAHIGPRTLKDVNSEEYAWQTTAYLKTLYGFKEASLDRWIAALEEAEQHRIYDLIPPEKPYGSMDALLVAEIGETAKTSTAVVMTRAQQPATLFDVGRPTVEEQTNKGDDITFISDRGTAADYLTARIARDHPDILSRMKAGEYKSVRAAATAAGLVKQRVSIPLDPDRAASILVRRFKQEGRLDELLTALTKALTAP